MKCERKWIEWEKSIKYGDSGQERQMPDNCCLSYVNPSSCPLMLRAYTEARKAERGICGLWEHVKGS